MVIPREIGDRNTLVLKDDPPKLGPAVVAGPVPIVLQLGAEVAHVNDLAPVRDMIDAR